MMKGDSSTRVTLKGLTKRIHFYFTYALKYSLLKKWRDIKNVKNIFKELNSGPMLIQYKREFKGNSFEKCREDILYWSKKRFIKKLYIPKNIG